jgi:hypothetical protein
LDKIERRENQLRKTEQRFRIAEIDKQIRHIQLHSGSRKRRIANFIGELIGSIVAFCIVTSLLLFCFGVLRFMWRFVQ